MTKIKATKKLTDIDFNGKDAAVALVGKAQGGAANGFTSLLVKSAKYTDEHVDKAAKIRITMDIEDFLVKFYGLWYDDAEVLARALGFESEKTDDFDSYQDYIDSQVAAIEVLKGLEQSENVEKSLSELEPDDYLSLLKSQELLEKAFKRIDKGATNSKPAVKVATLEKGEVKAVVEAKELTIQNVEASPSNTISKNKETPMTKEVKVTEQEVLTEMVEKSALDSIQKALQEQTVALEKALASVAQFEKEKAEAIQKSRKDLLVATVKDADKAEALFKGFANVESQEVFEGAVKALDAIMQVQKSSDLFKEVGVSAEVVKQDEQDPVMKAVKALVAKSQAK
jgi:hypothetical protein